MAKWNPSKGLLDHTHEQYFTRLRETENPVLYRELFSL